VPVFLVVGDTGPLAERIRAALPAGSDFRVETARYTEKELLELQAAIEEDRQELIKGGVSLVSTGLDTPNNRVIVGVDGDIDAAAAVLRRYGTALEVRTDRASVADACTYRNCWLPQKAKGGIHVYKSYTVYPCTSGFIVKRPDTGNFAILTAGHCIEVNGGYGQIFKHGSTTVYTIGGSRYETWAAGANADAGIIALSSGSVPTPKNTFHVRESGIDSVRALNGVTSHAAQSVGLFVCRSGLGTGNSTCGHVVEKNVTRPSCVGETNCKLIDYQFEVDFDSVGGDSGGPIYANGQGYGIHIHSDDADDPAPRHGWYSSLEFARSEYFGVSGVTYNFCLISDCSLGWPY
jgi:Trypsin